MKVLIADDEDYTREGLIETVHWEQFGIDEIMQAVNGAEAVRITRWFQPDIVISDIQMPQINGLEFAEKVTKMNPECQIIFISGYMEIEYLKTAIQLAAVDYIEKPVDLKALEAAVGKAAAEVRRIRKGKEEAREHRELQQQKLFRLLTDRETDEKTLNKLFSETNVLAKGGWFQCIAAMFRHPEGRIDQRIEQILKSSGFGVVSAYHSEKRQYEFILSFQENERYRLMPLYRRVLEKLPDLCIGVGIEASSYHNVYNSYRTADAALNRAFYNTEERLFTIDESIAQKKFISPGVYGEFLQVMNEPVSALTKWCEELFDRLRHQQYFRKEQVCTLLISLLNALFQKYPYLLDDCRAIQGEETVSAHVMEMTSLDEVKKLFDAALEKIRDHQQEQSGHSRIVRGVLEYMESHYMEESLSITEIAEHLHLSSAYLNVLFRQETKMTLKQYMSNFRLEKAKKMLEQDYDKITEIAQKCGYANSNYFAKVFREAVGMTPLEYRNQKGDRDEAH